MSRNLGERFNEISQELQAMQEVTGAPQERTVLQRRVAALQAEQAELQQTMRFVALFHLRDEAWRALSHSPKS